MNIYVNGIQEKVQEQMTLMDYMIKKGLEPESLIIEHNMRIVKKDELVAVKLNEADVIEVLRIVGGG